MKKIATFLFILTSFQLSAQIPTNTDNIWELTNRESIILRVDSTMQLPHKDNIEMSGKKVSAIIYYAIDENQNLTIEKDIIFPQLRTYNKSNEPNWKKYRAYFRRKVGKQMTPRVAYNNQIIIPSKVDSIEIGGMITFYYAATNGLQITKCLYPSMDDRLLVEEWQVKNLDTESKDLAIAPVLYEQSELGYKGNYTFTAKSEAEQIINLQANQVYTFPLYLGAVLNDEKAATFNYKLAKKSRQQFLETCQQNLTLKTPDAILNQLFYFSKIRAAESIFNSSMGLVHSPGGGNYYVGIWANDQVEYSGPFFPYMGYETANTAAFNTYKKFLENIPQDSSHIAYAFEVDGNFPMLHLDRGDAAMLAYGTSLYLLNTGNMEQAKELWPLIEWSLNYCQSKQNKFGAVQSESDEMEGRIETGTANLSTSTLYYGGLKFSIANALGMSEKATDYEKRLAEMEQVIENYFGATLEGLDTYRYFDKNKYLRHWICLPLTMGIETRKEGTLKALFGKLWMDNGILVQYNPTTKDEDYTFWDRATLYALRGAFKVSTDDIAFEKLKQYSTKRLLGDHVPYAVEAYPENNMKHLSAESALYCRIFIEGLLGIEPTGFDTFKMTPSLPDDWDYLDLQQFYIFGQALDISIQRVGKKVKVTIQSDKGIQYEAVVKPNEIQYIKLKN